MIVKPNTESKLHNQAPDHGQNLLNSFEHYILVILELIVFCNDRSNNFIMSKDCSIDLRTVSFLSSHFLNFFVKLEQHAYAIYERTSTGLICI